VLPTAATLPAPFNALPVGVQLAPLVIFKNAAGTSPTGGGDMLQIMTGASGLSEAALTILPGSIAAAELRLNNTIGMKAGDLVMVSEATLGCMVQQVNAGFDGDVLPSIQTLPFGGTYRAATVGGRNLVDYAATSPVLLHLGNVTGRVPQFAWIGVGPNRTLQTYDLLQTAELTTVPQPPQALTEGVIEMHALYGVDTDNDKKVDVNGWKDPGTAPWDSATLLNGSAASAKALSQIVSVRVALVLSAPLVEKDAVPGPTQLTYFSDLGTAYAKTVKWSDFGTDEQRRRHRIVDFTVPVRSVLK